MIYAKIKLQNHNRTNNETDMKENDTMENEEFVIEKLCFLEMGGYLPRVRHDERTQEEEYDLHDIDDFVKIPFVDVEHG